MAETGDALDITDCSATLTGYAYLPSESDDAEEYIMYEVGIIYDTKQSFKDAKKGYANGLDGNKKFTVKVTGLTPLTTYYYKTYVKFDKTIHYGLVKSFETEEPPCPEGAVDLGIVITREDGSRYKLFWAKSNLSESGLCANPQDYGDYYAWGETKPKADYSWDSYKFRTSGDFYTNIIFSKYNTKDSNGPVDNITELQRGENPNETVDDVARAKLGGKWRMPTDEEWMELLAFDNEWTNINGKKGRLITGKNGNSIFLPAAGRMDDTNLYYDGSYGYYWSSSLDPDNPHSAWSFYVYSQSCYWTCYTRCTGLPVRPVSE